MKQHVILSIAFLCTVVQLTAQQPVNQTPLTGGPKPDTTKPAPPKKPAGITDKVKSSKKIDGFFTLYQDTVTGSIQFYVKKDQLDKEIIYQSFSINGLTDFYLNQSMHRTNFNFRIKKYFDRIEFHRVNYNFYYDPASPLSKTKDVDKPEAVFYTDKIGAEDESGYLINADALFISEKMDGVRPLFPPGIPPGAIFNMGTLNPAKSKYHKVRSYPNNTDVVVDMAYENPAPFNSGGKDITDPRYVRIRIQHSFIELPKNDFRPRRDDPRVGFFSNEVDDQTDGSSTPYKDFILRWNLVKKDPSAAISEPVEPIVWWVENTTPYEYRDIIVEAGLKWNEAFEKAGFKNAVQMKIMPDNATWEPEDLRYNVIRWVSSSSIAYSAIGPQFSNPKTGQILGSDISFEWKPINSTWGMQDLYEQLNNTAIGEQENLLQDKIGIHKNHRTCFSSSSIRGELQSAIAFAAVHGENAEEVKEIKRQLILWMVMHEMGHTLGLWHNMKASQMLSPAELNNKELTRRIGLYGSVMEYPAVNIASDKSKQGDYFTTKVGPYDIWAIEYGYTPFSATEEESGLKKILERSTDPKLAFGNDGDDMRSLGRGIDPRVMVYDLSNDMVSFAEDRLKMLNTIVPKLKNAYSKDGASYATLKDRFALLINQRLRMSLVLGRYIGGVYVDRSFVGQSTPNKPYTPVPQPVQKKAMEVLGKYIFAPNAYDGDAFLFPYLQTQRRGVVEPTEDMKVQATYGSIQNAALIHILHPVTLTRVNNSSLYGNTYSLSDIFNDLTKYIFDADMNSSVNLYRQNLQTNYIKAMISMQLPTTAGYDNATRSLAMLTLKKLRTRLASAVSVAEQTKAHRAMLIQLIDKAFETK